MNDMTQQDDITQRVLTDDEIMRSAISACDSLNITRFHEIGAPSKTIMDDAGLLELGRAIESTVLSQVRAPVADERAAVDPCGYVAVKVSAVDWLKDKFPALTIKAGLCERIGGRLYTITRLMRDHDAALASAPVAGEAQPEIEQMAVNRYRPVPDGKFSYKVVAGDGSRSLYTGTKDSCLRVAAKLTEAFLDGAFVASDAAPQACAEYERGHADGWAAGWDQAIKQPQADKDGGQQRAGDAVRDALWTLTEHNALHFGEQHSTVIQGRAALSAPQAEQGERDA